MQKREKPRPAKPSKAITGSASKGAVYQLKMTLIYSQPEIWRRVLVPGDIGLDVLHWVIQDAMGWTNSHLHHFVIDRKTYSDPEFALDELGDMEDSDEGRFTLRQVAPRVGKKFTYEYDFGDCWEHRIQVEKIIDADSRFTGHPVCIGGEQACPPEDCGGIGGYYDSFLPAILDPAHEEHKSWLEWIGGKFDPEAFDIKAVNRLLKRIGPCV